jgi:hypothetical protein
MKQLQTTLPGLVSAVQAADSGSFSARPHTRCGKQKRSRARGAAEGALV